MEAFDLLTGVTARLASTARFDEIVETVVHEIVRLGFRGVWIAVLNEDGTLTTLKDLVDGVEATYKAPVALDARTPVGIGFRERRMINVVDPAALHVLERSDEQVPPGKIALRRQVFDRLRGRPFASGPLLGSRGHPVGALGLSAYLGGQPIPDAMFAPGVLRVLIDHLGFAIERAVHVAQLDAKLSKAQAAIASDAPLKAIGELAATVAHDLNNLSGIAMLALGVGQRSPSDAFDVLPRIERAVRAFSDLVGRLQRISRPPVESHTADLGQVIDDILIMVKPMLREQSIEVDVDLPAVPPVRCDAALLHQVLLNLLLNAHDALGAVANTQRRIAFRVRNDEDQVHVTVADNGPGIAPAVLARLFQPLNTTKAGAHLGLGLAAARTALKSFGAQIDGRNPPGGGAQFEVSLAAAPPGALEAANPPRPLPAVADHARHARILAVDDDPDVVDIIQAFLEPLGYELTTATTPAQAIAAATSQPFDLVLCDIGLPKQSGLDVCRLLRDAGFRGKVVLMTGWDTHTLDADRRAAECDELLKKPFVGTDLIHVIDTLLA
jgi:signal transduction histidine kinase/CheY-like chemotaxis protein